MITADLIIGPSVGWAQEDVFKLAVLQPEGHSDESASGGEGAWGGTPRQLYLDRSVVKGGPFHNRIRFAVRNLPIFRHLDGAFAEVIDGFEFHSVRDQLVDRLAAEQRRQRKLGDECR